MSLLAHSRIEAPDAVPERWMIFVHGILGTRSNWRGLARRFVKRRPEWGALLVDLRQHGDSQGFVGPHDVAAAAADLDALHDAFGSPIEGILGHSFGGKVALAWASRRGSSLRDVWIIDSMPGARPDLRGSALTLDILDLLERLPFPFDDRKAFVDAVEREGIERGLGQWLAMNLERDADGRQRLKLDTRSIRELLDDYFKLDLWSAFENPASGVRMHAVIGGASDVYSDDDRRRSLSASLSSPSVETLILPDAGHWVHVDAPLELVDLLAARQS